MSINIILTLICAAISINSIQIPFVRNAIFVSVSKSNSTTITNITCDQCLCMLSSSYLLLNCFPNNTCQFFFNFPRTYNIQKMINASFYFLQGIFPNASLCCMPNLTYVLDKLNNATPTYGSILAPHCLSIDNHGYLVTISQTNSTIVRFDQTNLTLIDQINTYSTSLSTIKYYNNNYYIGAANRIIAIDSNTLTIHNNITATNISSTRDVMFLNDGNTLVVASTGNKYLFFFNRSGNSSTNYNIAYNQAVNYTNPHGLFFVNDTFFYTTSWAFNSIYSYSANQNNTGWKEDLFLDARSLGSASSGNHITIDECGRFWFSLNNYGVKIFDNQGSFLANFTITNSSIFDTMVTDNYVIYLSDTNLNRVIRIDPDIKCPVDD